MQSCLAALAVASARNNLSAYQAGQKATDEYLGRLPRDDSSRRLGLVALLDAYAELKLDSEVALALRDDIWSQILEIDFQDAERAA